MKTSPILLLVILSFVAATFATPVNHGTDPQQLIDQSCKLASIFDGRFTKQYCVSAINSAPYNRRAKMSIHDLASLSLNLLYKNVSSTKAKIDLMAHGGQGQKNPTLRQLLQRCSSMYSEANGRAIKAKKFMEAKNYTDADRTVSMIQGDGEECEALYRAETSVVSPFTRENIDTQYLSAMTTLFIRFFDKSYTPWGLPIVKKP